jgi:hypothetical protein
MKHLEFKTHDIDKYKQERKNSINEMRKQLDLLEKNLDYSVSFFITTPKKTSTIAVLSSRTKKINLLAILNYIGDKGEDIMGVKE